MNSHRWNRILAVALVSIGVAAGIGAAVPATADSGPNVSVVSAPKKWHMKYVNGEMSCPQPIRVQVSGTTGTTPTKLTIIGAKAFGVFDTVPVTGDGMYSFMSATPETSWCVAAYAADTAPAQFVRTYTVTLWGKDASGSAELPVSKATFKVRIYTPRSWSEAP